MNKKMTALFVSAILLLSGCSGSPAKQSQSYTDTLFDTVIQIEIYDDIEGDVLKGCEELCKKYDAMFSNKIEDSEISQINHAGGSPVEVSEETITLLKEGIYYGGLSGGAFDITIAPVSDLWDFKSEESQVPAPDTIAGAVSHVDYHNIIIKGNTVRLTDPDAGIDVGAIAKGYIADQIRDYLESQGVGHAMINLGGNVLAMGSKADGSDYNIGIQKPFDETGEPITAVRISDKSVVTSGIYQRYFEANGMLYHHILDPATGYPCENNLYSVTIITDSSLAADALSTTCFLLGYDEGMELINQLEDVDAIFITEDNGIHYSKDFPYEP